MRKKYKAIFFDWDGTAVMSRRAPADEAVSAMRPLLDRGIKLAIISGTTYDNIAGGAIETCFTKEQLDNLYMGLGRGAYNYAFADGKAAVFSDKIPDGITLEKIHRICFDIHMELKNKYNFDTDVVFSRPNYCKIDLMVSSHRGDRLFMQASELDMLKESLKAHNIEGGLPALLELSKEVGKRYGIDVAPTCDAKYLEVGISSKSSNVDAILDCLCKKSNIEAGECSFWGDEYVGIEEGIYGSDSFMRTEKTSGGDFFDVSDLPGNRPEGVEQIGGGVNTFLEFLRKQA